MRKEGMWMLLLLLVESQQEGRQLDHVVLKWVNGGGGTGTGNKAGGNGIEIGGAERGRRGCLLAECWPLMWLHC